MVVELGLLDFLEVPTIKGKMSRANSLGQFALGQPEPVVKESLGRQSRAFSDQQWDSIGCTVQLAG